MMGKPHPDVVAGGGGLAPPGFCRWGKVLLSPALTLSYTLPPTMDAARLSITTLVTRGLLHACYVKCGAVGDAVAGEG